MWKQKFYFIICSCFFKLFYKHCFFHKEFLLSEKLNMVFCFMFTCRWKAFRMLSVIRSRGLTSWGRRWIFVPLWESSLQWIQVMQVGLSCQRTWRLYSGTTFVCWINWNLSLGSLSKYWIEALSAIFTLALRPCAMVVPDFELICEIMLVAEGFVNARILAGKFITLYTLCKELLSKQVKPFVFEIYIVGKHPISFFLKANQFVFSIFEKFAKKRL